jgi:predicted Zn-dependent protease
MDCRKRMFWSLALLGGMAGCTTTGTSNAPITTTPNSVQLSQINPADIKKESDQPKKQPTPKICVAYGNAAANEAAARSNEPVVANQMRDDARKAYQQALRLDPKCLDASMGLAKLYLQMEDYTHAVDTLTAATKQYPNNSGVWFELGMIYSNRKDWNPAIEYLSRAAQLEPENRLYVNTLGHALARAGKPQEALQVYMRVNPEAKACLNVARMMLHMNMPELSWQYLQRAVQKDPQVPGAQELLVQLQGRDPANVQQTTATDVQIGAVEPIANQ